VVDQAHNLRVLAQKKAKPVHGIHGDGEKKQWQKQSNCRTIAVTSGKGGVGKTNIALMLAIGLAKLKKKVLLLDADLGLANVHILLGLAPKKHLGDILEGNGEISEVICQGPYGLDILPGASGLEALANMDSVQHETLRKRLHGIESTYDFMIIDTSAGIGRGTTEFCRHADLGLLVLTPEPTSLSDAYAMVKVLYQKKIHKLAVLVNMAQSEPEGKEIFDKLNMLVVKFLKEGLRLIDICPADPDVPRLIRKQKIILLESPQKKISLKLQTCARRLAGLPPLKKNGFFSRLFRHRDEP